MIKSVRLNNWKSYRKAHIEFEPGTTFLVASNGVGKTSVVQALHFAIFGGDRLLGPGVAPVTNAIRGMSERAEVVCALTLDGRDVLLRRSLGRDRRGQQQFSAIIEGTPVGGDQWLRILSEVAGMDATGLAALAIMAEGSLLRTKDAGVDVASHLSEIFGVGRLHELALEAERIAGKYERDTDSLRRQQRSVEADRENQRYEASRADLAGYQAQLGPLEQRLAAAHAAKSRRESWMKSRRDEAESQKALVQWTNSFATVRASAHHLIGGQLEVGDDDAEGLEYLLAQERDRLVAQAARLESEIHRAQRQLRELSQESALCPTCLRPLSQRELAKAKRQHEVELSRLSGELEGVPGRLSAVGILQARVSELLRQKPRREMRPPQEELAPDVDDNAEDLVERLQRELSALREKIAMARATQELVARQRADRLANEQLQRLLVSGYYRSERARVAAQTLTGLAEAISAEKVAPLAREVEKTWPELWQDDALTMAPSGELAVNVAGMPIPFSEFSGGQRTVAQILVSLLALEMATRCPFLILDEPLEHLDAVHRRSLVNLLVKATSANGPLRQVIVTTYEETVTRRFREAPVPGAALMSGAAHVKYVRRSP